MICRENCGACCTAPSITSAIPGMPQGKPAGTACVNLDPEDYRCRIWGTAEYPDVCATFKPLPDACGASREEAIQLLSFMEMQTS